MRRRDSLRCSLALGVAAVAGAGAAHAQGPAQVPAQVPAPESAQPGSEPVVLRVGGQIRRPPQGERDFSLAALEELGLQPLVTLTPWTRGEQSFSGVPLQRLLDAVECLGTTLDLTAINRYTTSMPAEDARLGAFLATRLDGQPMRVRDRGPIWLVYPWSQRPELDRSLYHERAIWQLRHIVVR